METCLKMSLLYLSVCILIILNNGCVSKQNSLVKLKDQGICKEITTGKMWQIDKGGKFTSLNEAESYATSLQLGGFNDWRVPTKDEYFQLHYLFSEGKNNDCAMNSNGDFWAISEGEEPTLGHWETYHLCGAEFKYVESLETTGYVRAVRP